MKCEPAVKRLDKIASKTTMFTRVDLYYILVTRSDTAVLLYSHN